MKKVLVSLVIAQAGLFVNAYASEDVHDCSAQYFDITDEQTNRLPFSGVGDTLEFKVPTETVAVSVIEEKRKACRSPHSQCSPEKQCVSLLSHAPPSGTLQQNSPTM